MTLGIFNPCTGTSDQIEIVGRCGEDEWTEAREARLAEVRALVEEIAEPVPVATSPALR